MSTNIKHERYRSSLMRAAAAFIARESNRTSLITVTNISRSRLGEPVTVFVTVLPQHEEKRAVEFLGRKRGQFREFLGKELKMRALPTIEFAIDFGEKNRQRIEEASTEKT